MTSRHRTDERVTRPEALDPIELRERIEAIARYRRCAAERVEFGNFSALAAQERGEPA